MKKTNLDIAEKYVNNFDLRLVQAIILLLFSSFIGLFLLEKKLIIGFLFLFIMPLYVYIIIKRYRKMKDIIENHKNENIKNTLIKKINENIFILYKYMKELNIENKTINFTIEKFTNEFRTCKKIHDYEFLLNQIINDYEKYENVYKNFTLTKPKSEILKALRILELPLNTSDFEIIKKKHKQLCKLYHPDNNLEFETKIKEINEAYSILKNKRP